MSFFDLIGVSDGVGRGAHEGLGLQILLEGYIEERLDLPAIFVNRSDIADAKAKMVGEEYEGAARVRAREGRDA